MRNEFRHSGFEEPMFGKVITPCVTCIHLHQLSPVPQCEAFPERIPEKIIRGNVDHTGPVEGDGGIRYSPHKEKLEAKKAIEKQQKKTISAYYDMRIRMETAEISRRAGHIMHTPPMDDMTDEEREEFKRQVGNAKTWYEIDERWRDLIEAGEAWIEKFLRKK